MYRLDTVLLKPFSDCLSGPITDDIDRSINMKSFPRAWKTAIITPIFKAGDLLELCNYIPISILPVNGLGQNNHPS